MLVRSGGKHPSPDFGLGARRQLLTSDESEYFDRQLVCTHVMTTFASREQLNTNAIEPTLSQNTLNPCVSVTLVRALTSTACLELPADPFSTLF